VSSPSSLVLRGGRPLGPDGPGEPCDLELADGVVGELRPAGRGASAGDAIEAGGCWLLPGPIDAHVHLRDPGFTDKETLGTGLLAAAAGGFCGVAAMPNTLPPLDSAERIRELLERAQSLSGARLYAIGSASQDREGMSPVRFEALAEAGARGFSDDGDQIRSEAVLLGALAASARLGLPVMEHCEDPALVGDGVLNQGEVARALGVPGRPAAAEIEAVRRGINLAERTGGHLHVQHLSSAGALDLVREARRRGLAVTAEVTPHHLRLTEEAAAGGDPNARVNPPLRTEDDREALIAGLADGTIDVIATDHAPHTEAEKARGLADAPPGMVGLETALPLVLELAEQGRVELGRLVDALCGAPARLLGLPGRGRLEPGAPADVTVFDPRAAWVVDPARFRSRGRNTPFSGWTLHGRVRATVVAGRVVFEDDGRS